MADLKPQDVADLVNEVLSITGMTQDALAAEIKVSQSTVHKWRQGIHNPRKDRWDKFVAWGIDNPATRHLFIDQLSLNGLVQSYSPETKLAAFEMMKIFLRGRN
jgi:hypothetical protein